LADWIGFYVQRRAEAQSLFSIDHFSQISDRDIADLLMKEARANRAIDFDHRGYPWSIATRSNGTVFTELFSEAPHDPA
jgi:hypothetical protein